MELSPQVLQLREEFLAAWKTGSRPNIAELIGDLEEPARTAALRELVTLDVEYRRRLRESPYASEYVAQFPEAREVVESVFSDTQSLVGQSPPETLLRPPSQPVSPERSIDATRTSIGTNEDRERLAPTQSPSPTEDRSKSIVPLNEFIRSLTDSGLMDQDELDAFLSSLPADHRPANGKQLAQELHRCKKLTRFQVQAVYQGKTRGLVVGNYVVLDKLGEGGMGQVYKARHKRMDRIVALKVLPAAATKSPESVKRFQREVKAAAKLTHPHIVTAHDADEHRGVHFLVMEYVEGKDLAGFVREKGPLPVKQAVDCIIQAAKGLEYAHRQGIIHRDIKPHNLLLDKSGTVKILDMGLARLDEQMHKQADDDGLTRSGAVMGTLDYMSPEQAIDTKTADARADIYSLGCTLHFLLTGKPPYSGDSLAAKIVAHRVQPVPSLRVERKDVPEALDAVFQKMLAKTADERQASMEVLLQELEQSRFAIDVGDVLDIGLASPTREEPLDLAEDETTTLADPASSSVDMTKRWVAPSVGPATESRSWLREYKTLLIGLAMLVPATLILALGIMATLRTKSGDLIVEVNESGAKVEVLDAEGKVVVTGVSGQEPIAFSVEPGQHRIRVEKDGFAAYTEQIDIESRGKRSVTARLERKPAEQGTLVLKGAEAGALVEVLDPAGKIQATYRTKGPELSIPMGAGSHRIRIEKNGAELLAQDVSVTAKQSLDLDTSSAFQAKKQTVGAQPTLPVPSRPESSSTKTRSVDREVAEWILGIGGTVTVRTNGNEKEVAKIEELPTKEYCVVGISAREKKEFSDLTVHRFHELTELRTLHMSGTAITNVGLEHVLSAPRINDLDISHTAIDDNGLRLISRIADLYALNAMGTRITDDGMRVLLGNCRKINWLGIGWTQCGDATIAQLEFLPSLHTLFLGGMDRVTAGGLGTANRIHGLQVVFLDGCRLNDDSLGELVQLFTLRSISLNHTEITDRGLSYLERLLDPSEISLIGTRITVTGVQRLSRRFPACVITVDPALASSLTPRRQRAPVAPDDHSNVAEAYLGLAPGTWVNLLRSQERLTGWTVDVGAAEHRRESWTLSISPTHGCGLMSFPVRGRDIALRAHVIGGDWQDVRLRVRDGPWPGAGGAWGSVDVFVTREGSTRVELSQGQGSITLGKTGPLASFNPNDFECAVAAVSARLIVFLNGKPVQDIWDSRSCLDSSVVGRVGGGGGSVVFGGVDCQVLDHVTTPTIQKILDAPTDIQRETAEWILRLGGTLSITKDGIESAAPTAQSLPASPFSIVRVSMVGAKDLMTDLALSKLGRLPDLQSLDLSNVPIGDAGLEHLKNAKSLTTLNVTGTNVTAAGVAELQAALPKCKITGSPESQETSEATPKPDTSKPSTTASPSTGSTDNWKLPAGTPSPAIAPFDAAKASDHQEAWAKELG